MESNPGHFRILTICTGNVCRSPLAAQLINDRLRDTPVITVTSAGVQALVDEPMPEPAQELARSLGVRNPGGHLGRQIDRDLVESADLILVMAREHRRAVVELTPRATRKVFTIRGFARLAEATTDLDLAAEIGAGEAGGIERLRAAVRAVTLSRDIFQPLRNPGDDDVTDPYRQGPKVYAQTAEDLLPAVERTVELLRKSLTLPVEGEN
ncbi:hypothetical protein [Corynebacterium pacaense]|uniref:arsenate reductase/protein-tyrosine-phosphatase family protein n=1 Tax=Corynebacterium pacaense TaxID=1816684 RepID=UPI0009BBE311|nr:hypothetical protein [Corynebacterium pacaense]